MSRSSEWHQRAIRVTPGGVNSPVRSFKHVGVEPLFFERAEGACLYDVDGRQYVDFCLSFGPHILGHSHPAVVAALQKQAARGTSFGACHPKEVELAEGILKAYPFLQSVRLVNSGTEAVMTAIRVARGFTRRNKILKFEGCYHGHSDGLLAKAGSGVAALSEASSGGVPQSVVEDTLTARLDEPATVESLFAKHGREIAAIVIEPIPANYGLLVPSIGFHQKLFQIARQHGALVLFDEVISGFRVGFGGASAYYGLEPDLVTLGKIIGGGLPLAAIAGRKEIMDVLAPVGAVYQAGTLSGNPLATAAGCAVLDTLAKESPYAALEERCRWFAGELKGVLEKDGPVEIRQVGSLFFPYFGKLGTSFPPEVGAENSRRYADFFKRALAAGVYFPPSPYEVSFLSTAHSRSVLEGVLERLNGRAKA